MTDLGISLSEIELKIRKLVMLKDDLLAKNGELVRSNEELLRQVERLNAENAELREKLNKIVIVNALGNEKEIEEGRTLIRSLVKEIDKSIAILSAEH